MVFVSCLRHTRGMMYYAFAANAMYQITNRPEKLATGPTVRDENEAGRGHRPHRM